jgi:ferredoxin
MEINGKRVLVCDCEGTMPLDGNALAHACRAAPDPRGLATQLCGTELGRFILALGETGAGSRGVVVACTHQAPRFQEQQTDAGSRTPVTFVNIRETAGWSEEAGEATAKIAALLRQATVDPTPPPHVGLDVAGVLLIYGSDRRALDAARRLRGRLDVSVLLTPGAEILSPQVMDVPVMQGRLRTVTGHIGAFEALIDDYAAPVPSSRARLAFAVGRDGTRKPCDLILDLTGGAPLFPAHETRDGYLRPDPADAAAVEDAIARAGTLAGRFEKPLYVSNEAERCAHSRLGKTGCTRCIDLCPPRAISPEGDHVAVDPFACSGCGACAAACPTGALRYAASPAADLFARLAALLDGYDRANGRNPVLLVHDRGEGDALIHRAARLGRGLPARVLPFAVNEVAQLGLEFFAAAIVQGAGGVRVLTPADGAPADGAPGRTGLVRQIGYVSAILAGLGYGEDCVAAIETDEPDALTDALYTLLPLSRGRAAVSPEGDKPTRARAIVAALRAAAPIRADTIPLPPGAPFGAVAVAATGCTLCLDCAAVCPTGALRGDGDGTCLRFDEHACVQCGLCRSACPEHVLDLVPRFDFAAAARGPVVLKARDRGS